MDIAEIGVEGRDTTDLEKYRLDLIRDSMAIADLVP
jgi:hypothetical protein